MKYDVRGITFLDAMSLMFIGLNLAGVIDWPWWVVMTPLLGQVAILMIIEGVSAR